MRVSEPRSEQALANELNGRGSLPDNRSDSSSQDLLARTRMAKGLFLLAAGLSFIASVSLWFLVDREQGLFVGLWVPSILALGALLLSGNRGAR